MRFFIFSALVAGLLIGGATAVSAQPSGQAQTMPGMDHSQMPGMQGIPGNTRAGNQGARTPAAPQPGRNAAPAQQR